MASVVDPTLLYARGAAIVWNTEARRLDIPGFGNQPPTVQLRWMPRASLGLPTGPFKVWSRPHLPEPFSKALTVVAAINWFGQANLYTWAEGSACTVMLSVSSAAQGTAIGFVGAPYPQNFCAATFFAAGGGSIELNAQAIDGVLLPPGATVTSARGVLPGPYANTAGWRLVEVVGLPVGAAWAGIGQHAQPQGLISALTDPMQAAIERLGRGAPPFGWGPTMGPALAAPPWQAPDPRRLVDEVNGDVLDLLAPIVGNNPPNVQAAQQISTPLPPPVTASGQQMAGAGSTTKTSPLTVTYMAAGTDAFLSLVLGFGTAYDHPEGRLDYMVTARWEAGLDGRSAAFDLAAVVPEPSTTGSPVQPTNLAVTLQGVLRPLAVDGPWRATNRIAWDRFTSTPLAGAASVAVARAGTAPATPTVPLLAARRSGGLRPLAINTPSGSHPPDPERNRVNLMDREMEIPVDPGTAQVTYGVAVQDIWGVWSGWGTVGAALTEPVPEPVRIVKLGLSAALGAGSACPATLEVEFLLDWRIRSPGLISFVGTLYAAAEGGAPPPASGPPAGFDRSVASGGPPLDIAFTGDVPSAPGATFEPLTEGGEKVAAGFGPAQGLVSRRCRMTVTGLALDFAAAPFVGVALWGRVQERVPPQRFSTFPTRPAVASASDPRPPIVTVRHVKLASLPDAGGSSHAVIAWDPPVPPAPAVLGYHVYETTEAALLDAYGLPLPEPDATLDARLKTLTDAFRANPLRHPFTRMNATPFTATSIDVALPRGSNGIHCYVVLGLSHSLIEALWPAPGVADTALIALGLPRIARPAPPVLEVDRVLDASTNPPTFKARVTVATRPGHRAKRVDLHRVRVDDAARNLDTMGPPLATLTEGRDGWTVTQVADAKFGPFIGNITGIDAPGGSWRRVWYRAVAWSVRDDTRGLLPGRSPPSDAAWVVLPPSEGPALDPPQVGGSATKISLRWMSAASVPRTPLGPHLITVRAAAPGAPALISLDSPLNALATAQPAAGSGVWVEGTASGLTTYRAILRRASADDVVQVLIRLTDPLGRVGERTLTIGAGAVHPAPNLENLVVERVAGPPPTTILRFTSASPIHDTLDGPYLVRVIGQPFGLVPPPRIELPLSSVPTSAPPFPQRLDILREGDGPAFAYVATAQGNFGKFEVRITGPDGRTVDGEAS